MVDWNRTLENPFWFEGVARYCALVGDRECAFEALDRAYQEREPGILQLAVEPALDPLRDDSRFDDLLRRINYPDAS